MKIKWFGVSSFLITTDEGARIITDPYQHNYIPEGDLPPDYNPNAPGITERADVVTMTHSHSNAAYIWSVKGVPQLYTGGMPVEIKGVRFSNVVTLHHSNHGYNNIIGIEADGIRIRHLGDMGIRALNDEELAQVGVVDILMTPWDMSHELQKEVLIQLNPRIVLPMHFASADEYMRSMKGFTMMDNVSELTITKESLPLEMQIIMLKPALKT